jgi:hypothetical protein
MRLRVPRGAEAREQFLDLEEDKTARAVVFGLLREMESEVARPTG